MAHTVWAIPYDMVCYNSIHMGIYFMMKNIMKLLTVNGGLFRIIYEVY